MKPRREATVGLFILLVSVGCGETTVTKPPVATPVEAPTTGLTARRPSPPPPSVLERATNLCGAAKATLQACQAAGNAEAARAAADAGRAACSGASMLKDHPENPKFTEGFVAEKLQRAEASLAEARRLGPDCVTPGAVASVTAPAAVASGPAKTVSLEVIDLNAPQSAAVRVGDTLEVTLPLWTGTSWKIVGDQPLKNDFLAGYLGPNTDGMKYTFKIAGAAGKRTIKFVGTDANTPQDAPQVISVAITVE